MSLQNLATVIAFEASFILIDENHWKSKQVFVDRKSIPFWEINGEYNGLPVNDEAAINEIEKHRLKGINAVVFVWTTFWMLDYYLEMKRYLKNNCKCLLNTENVIAYDLQYTL